MMSTERGQLLLEEARTFFNAFRLDPLRSELEQIQALRAKARSALDWLEDTSGFEDAHQLLDEIGAFTRRVRADACALTIEDGSYFETCPVKLGHNRVGFSTAFLIRKSECSVCGQDPWDCDHVFGEVYDGVVAHQVITEAQALEVSLVSRPRMPDARIMKISVLQSELVEALGPAFSPGMPVMCDRCLTPCPGVYDDFDADANRVPNAE